MRIFKSILRIFAGVLFCTVGFSTLHAQWLDGGRTQSQTVQGNGALLVDHGTMYFFNADNFIQKSKDNGKSWIDVADSGLPPKGPGVAKSLKKLSAAGGRIYGGMNFGTGTGMPVYSSDDGETWNQDTLGAPGHALGWDGLPVVTDIYAWGHWVFANFDGPNLYYIKSFDGPFVLNQYMVVGANNPHSVIAKGDTLFVSGSKVYYTVDGGANWVTPANNGYTGNQPVLYLDGRRLYMFAKHGTQKPPSLFYSDDNAENWTEIDISAVTGKKDGAQTYYFPSAAFIKGDRIELAVPQSGFNTAPNLWKSVDLGKSWSSDSLGLPDSYVETAITFAYTPDGTLWFVPGHNNIFKQKIDDGVAGVAAGIDATFSIRPNPSHDRFTVSSPKGRYESFELRDMLGRVVKSGNNLLNRSSFEIDVHGLGAGAYLLLSKARNGEWRVSNVMVE